MRECGTKEARKKPVGINREATSPGVHAGTSNLKERAGGLEGVSNRNHLSSGLEENDGSQREIAVEERGELLEGRRSMILANRTQHETRTIIAAARSGCVLTCPASAASRSEQRRLAPGLTWLMPHCVHRQVWPA